MPMTTLDQTNAQRPAPAPTPGFHQHRRRARRLGWLLAGKAAVWLLVIGGFGRGAVQGGEPQTTPPSASPTRGAKGDPEQPSVGIRVFPTGVLGSNCCVVFRHGEGVIIDAGSDDEAIRRFLQDHGLKIRYIIITHGHVDHTQGAMELKRWTGGQILLSAEDQSGFDYFTPERIEAWISRQERSSHEIALIYRHLGVVIDTYLSGGETFQVGGMDIRILAAPGHTPGSICVLVDGKYVFTGDTIYRHSLGRTDQNGSDESQLLRSIREKIFSLPDSVVAYPGHGDPCTVGELKANHPTLR